MKEKIVYRFTLQEFKEIINKIKKEDIDYFAFGGFAFDGFYGEESEHEDLDLIFFEKDKMKVVKLFKELGFKTYLHGRKHDYRNNNKKIDILFMQDKGDYYEILGNIKRDKISKGALVKKNNVKIEGFEFTIMPFEWFSLYLNSHHIESKREKLNKFVNKILPLCQKLPTLIQENVNKPDNMDKIEIK